MINLAISILSAVILVQAPLTRPTALLRDVMREQTRLRENFDKDIENGRAKPNDWEQRVLPLKEKTARVLSGYNIDATKDDELVALVRLFEFAELKAREAEAIEVWLRTARPEQNATGARAALVAVYVDLDRLEDASRTLKAIEEANFEGPQTLGDRVTAYRTLAFAQRNMGLNDPSLSTAVKGFELAGIAGGMYAFPGLRNAREIEAPRLAALALALLERKQVTKPVDALRSRWQTFSKDLPPTSIELFESELASARLIGSPVPPIAAKRWLNGSGAVAQDYQGKVTIIEFFAMWNEVSIEQIARTKEWLAEWESRGLQVIGVTRLFGRSDTEAGLSSAAELEHLESFRKKHRISWRIAVLGQDDPTNDERFGVTTLPALIVVDRSGKIKMIHRGTIDPRRMARELDRLMSEKQ